MLQSDAPRKDRYRAFVIYEHVYRIEGAAVVAELGGIQRYMSELVDLLVSLGVAVYVVQRGPGHGSEIPFGPNRTLVCVDVRGGGGFGRRALKILQRYHSDPLRDLLIWGTDTIARRTKFVRSLSIQHGIAADYTARQAGIRGFAVSCGLTSLYKFVQRRKALTAFERARYRVCVDHNFPNWYRTFRPQRWGAHSRVWVVPNFASVPAVSSREWSDRGGLRILFARRFVEKRGVYPMLEAARTLCVTYPSLRITFAGSGPLEPEIRALQQELGDHRVRVHPYHPQDTYKIHGEHEIAVIPTVGSEGTSLSLLEAMASECVVIASPVGGMTNVLLDGHNGLFAEPTGRSIAAAVGRIVEDRALAERLARNARTTVQDAFSFESWREAWKHVFHELLGS